MVTPNKKEIIAAQANMMFNSVPAAVRERLLEDRPFAEELGVGVTTTMHLSATVSITADRFVDAVRLVLNGAPQVQITTTTGKALTFDATLSNDGVTLVADEHTIAHPFIDALSPDREARLRAVENFSATLLVGPDRVDYWKALLAERGFTPTEYMDFVRDGRATPEMLFRQLQGRRNLDPATMVPEGLSYWSSILPIPEKGQAFADYVKAHLHPHQARMLTLNIPLACSRIGYSAASHNVVPFDLLQNLNPTDLEPSVAKEDPFSLLFAFEVAASRLASGPHWETIGTRALEKLFANKDALARRCELLSAGIVIAYARLARSAEWKGAPLYWRRLAAITQAGVLADTLAQMSEAAPFREWASKHFGPDFYWRALTDRGEGPLWGGDGAEPRALKGQLAGRFITAMKRIDENQWPAPWRAFAEGILNDPKEHMMLAFPGPMSDFVGYQPNIEPALFEDTLKALQGAPFKIPGLLPFIRLAKLTATEMARLKEFVQRTGLPSDPDDVGLYLAELHAVSHAAGVYRDIALGDAVADKSVEMFKQTDGLHQETVLGLLVDAASAYADEASYLSALAQRLERLAFTSSSSGQIDVLRNLLAALINVNPKYRAYLSRARATLEIKGAQPTVATAELPAANPPRAHRL
jgi:hypothetical protein